MSKNPTPVLLDDAKHDRGRHAIAERHICKDIVKGLSPEDIKQKLVNDDYAIGYKYAYPTAKKMYIEARARLIAAYSDETIKKYKPILFAHLMDIYQEARDTHKLDTAIKCIKEMGLMAGVYDQVMPEINMTKNDVTIKFGFDSDAPPQIPSLDQIQDVDYDIVIENRPPIDDDH